jgi:hypothetical protein
MLSLSLSAICSVALAALSHWQAPIPAFYVVLLMGAVVNAVGWPARSAILPQIVPMTVQQRGDVEQFVLPSCIRWRVRRWGMGGGAGHRMKSGGV